MKSLNRIINTVYNTPWLILPSVHRNYTKQLTAILEGKVDMPIMDVSADQEPDSEDIIIGGIQVIEVKGTICKGLSQMEMECGGGCDITCIQDQLESARDNANVNTVVLIFDTPGGTVTGVPETAELIKEIADTKRVVGYTDGLCASAGYWLASQCNEFYCSPSSQVGSVGCYSLVIDETKALDMEGIKVNVFKSGKYKLSGASFVSMTDEEKAMFQAESDKLGKQFRDVVKSNRTEIKDENLEAQVFDGDESTLNGYSDGNLNTIEELFQFLQTN